MLLAPDCCLLSGILLLLKMILTILVIFSAQEEDKENEETKEEEPPKEMSLEEWKTLQEKERVKSSFELRKAGEGEKKGMWKDTKVFKRTQKDEEVFAARRVSTAEHLSLLAISV